MPILIPSLSDELLERFNAKILKTQSCWLWTGAKRHGGYGVIKVGRKVVSCARIMVFLSTGIDPKNGFVLHSCDTPACCRPDHLRVGTQLDNMQDAKSRGRGNSGTRNHFAKLSSEDVLAIRREAATKSREELCRHYSVSARNALCSNVISRAEIVVNNSRECTHRNNVLLRHVTPCASPSALDPSKRSCPPGPISCPQESCDLDCSSRQAPSCKTHSSCTSDLSLSPQERAPRSARRVLR